MTRHKKLQRKLGSAYRPRKVPRERAREYASFRTSPEHLDTLFNRVLVLFRPKDNTSEENPLTVLERLNSRFSRGDSRR